MTGLNHTDLDAFGTVIVHNDQHVPGAVENGRGDLPGEFVPVQDEVEEPFANLTWNSSMNGTILKETVCSWLVCSKKRNAAAPSRR